MNNINQSTRDNRLQVLLVTVIALAMAGLVGCSTTGYKKSDAAAMNSQMAATRVQAESDALKATMEALNELVRQPAVDAEPQFVRFSRTLDELIASSRKAEGDVNRMWRKRGSYFEIWDKEIAAIDDSEIRATSQARRAEVSDQFDRSTQQYDEAQTKLRSLIDYLGDIRKALSIDLTRQGLAAAQPSTDRANDRAREVQAALDQSAVELDTLSARIASYRVQDVK